jgi:hypothetical protein
VEEGAWLIVRNISDREYLAWKVARGTMPWLNRVLEELWIHHEEHVVPPEVLTTIDEKRKKDVAKNATAVAKSKKRKRIGACKVVAKKQKVSMSSLASAASSISGSARASADAVEVSVENSSGGPTKAMAVVEEVGTPKDAGGQRVEGTDPPEPSAINPMPVVLGGDSSSLKDDGGVVHGGAPPLNDAEARDGSRRRPVGSSILEVSKDEAESQPPSVFQSVAFRPRA